MTRERSWYLISDNLLKGTENPLSNATIINLDLVRSVDEVRVDHVRLWFSKDHSIEVNGSHATDLLELLLKRSMISEKPTTVLGRR
jgi:hypothetical protein